VAGIFYLWETGSRGENEQGRKENGLFCQTNSEIGSGMNPSKNKEIQS
jgi:hypothetical protein